MNEDFNKGFSRGLEEVDQMIALAVKKLRKQVYKQLSEAYGYTTTHRCNCDLCEFN